MDWKGIIERYRAVEWNGRRLFLKRMPRKGGSARTIPPVESDLSS